MNIFRFALLAAITLAAPVSSRAADAAPLREKITAMTYRVQSDDKRLQTTVSAMAQLEDSIHMVRIGWSPTMPHVISANVRNFNLYHLQLQVASIAQLARDLKEAIAQARAGLACTPAGEVTSTHNEVELEAARTFSRNSNVLIDPFFTMRQLNASIQRNYSTPVWSGFPPGKQHMDELVRDFARDVEFVLDNKLELVELLDPVCRENGCKIVKKIVCVPRG